MQPAISVDQTFNIKICSMQYQGMQSAVSKTKGFNATFYNDK